MKGDGRRDIREERLNDKIIGEGDAVSTSCCW